MSGPVLTATDVSKRYASYSTSFGRFATWFGLPAKPVNEFWAVRDVSFSLKRGEALALIGQNGAGKSTLLKMITGTVRPTTGAIGVNGRISAILELGLGFNPEFTGRQNVYQAGGLMGFPREDLLRLMSGIEDFAELGEFFDQPLRVYSSGMQARLAFSLATAARPEVLIVDEVLSVGDAYFQAKCFERIAGFRKAGTTLLFVTHAMDTVVKHCDRAIFMKYGQAEFDGAPRDACNLYFDSLFGKRQAPNSKSDDTAPVMLSREQECFHTRFGYRKEEHRWGHGGARILDYLVRSGQKDYPHTIESNATTDFYFSVIFEHDYDDITPGVLLKSHDGLFIYGTNSFLASQGRTHIAAKAGERHMFRFSMPMPLNAGHYLVSFGISTGPQENLLPLDRRYDSVLVTIERKMGFWGLCDFNAHFETLNGLAYDD
ncbi:ABC transporter ATP-binding protein [Oricola cellulosilytica]|uniref:ABC transporter ATP-binding protein n=1 Tax=Oricola cellulosilytica TaxID=1429082 RepID=A0A4R0P375_9HYPH|nr:ABC transporter ATP-binding protein [Oricola cellulosilytica]TCD11304.1 ABC transporter ATP-binding protein [Oricola cellulosilytica]